MDWFFLIKTVLALVLIFSGTWYLRRDEKERYAFETFLFVAVMVCFAFIVGTAAESKIKLQNERVRVTALNKRNAAAKESTIYLTGIYAAGKKVEIKTMTDASWYWQNKWYVWRAPKDTKSPGGLSQTIELELPPGKDRIISFLANEHKGIVRVQYAGTEQILDCYSPVKKELRVFLKDTSPDILQKNSIASTWFIYTVATLLSLLLIVVTGKIQNGKLLIPMAGKASAPITYGKEDSLALKGIAILVLLLHHLFLVGRFNGCAISFTPFTEVFVTQLANYCKICVSLFAFMSGYGLFLNYRENTLSDKRWIAYRYIKTFSGFWIIVVLSWVVCQIINGRTISTYFVKNVGTGIVGMFLDFAGLANLFGTVTNIGTWWYMGAVLVFIFLTPLMMRHKGEYLPLYCFGVCVFVRVIAGGKIAEYFNAYLGGSTPYPFLLAFLMGALFAKNDLLVRVANARYHWLRLFAEVLLLAGSYKLYHMLSTPTFFDIKWGLLPLPFILFCVEFLIPRRGLHQFLVFLGRHSMNIFLTHTFIRQVYFNAFIYSFRHFIIVYLVLLVTSLALSILIEQIKKTLRYEAFIDALCRRIAGQESQAMVRE